MPRTVRLDRNNKGQGNEEIIKYCYEVYHKIPETFFSNNKIETSYFLEFLYLWCLDKELAEGNYNLSQEEIIVCVDIVSGMNKNLDDILNKKKKIIGVEHPMLLIFEGDK